MTDNSGPTRTVRVTLAVGSEATVRVTCTKSLHLTQYQDATFTWYGEITITDFVGGWRTGSGHVYDSFTVSPSSVSCSAASVPGGVSAVMTDNSGPSRTVRVTLAGGTSTPVRVRCKKSGYTTTTAEATFGALSPSAPCTVELPSWSAPIGSYWNESCVSLHLGTSDEPHYARRYEFNLGTRTGVTIDLSADEDTYLYLLSGHGESAEVYAKNDNVSSSSSNSQIDEDLDPGPYTIEATTAEPGKTGDFRLTATATEATAIEECETRLWGGSCAPAGQDVYEFTEGTLAATLDVAGKALGRRGSCVSQEVPVPDDKLSPHKLAALMLSIPVHELRGKSPSPMFLGRSDNLRWRWENRWLYSRKTAYVGERRAHWNTGVGLWQLDTWDDAVALNHAERADIKKGGVVVADHIADEFCAGKAIFGIWVGCKETVNGNRNCLETFGDIYDKDGDSLWVVATEGSQSDGGVQDRMCLWDSAQPAPGDRGFECFLYDHRLHEGNMDDRWPEGTDGPDSDEADLDEADRDCGPKTDSEDYEDFLERISRDRCNWLCLRQKIDGESDQEFDDRKSNNNCNGLTPLAVAFISLTYDDVRFAVFPKAETNYQHTLIKAVPQRTGARTSRLGPDGNGWYEDSYEGRFLYVREGFGGAWTEM